MMTLKFGAITDLNEEAREKYRDISTSAINIFNNETLFAKNEIKIAEKNTDTHVMIGINYSNIISLRDEFAAISLLNGGNFKKDIFSLFSMDESEFKTVSENITKKYRLYKGTVEEQALLNGCFHIKKRKFFY